jgi:hypothetical protein
MHNKLMTEGSLIPLPLKMKILGDWRRFIRGGFHLNDYTPELHQHLVKYGRFDHVDLMERENFWQHHFNTSLDRLRRFIKRFALIEENSRHDFGLILYYHTEDLNQNMCLEFEAVREILLGVIAEGMADIDELTITLQAHITQANEPERPFAAIRAEKAQHYNPALNRAEVALSNDIRELLAEPFKPPPVRIAQPILWAARGRPAGQVANGQNGAHRRPFSNWDSNKAMGRLGVNDPSRNDLNPASSSQRDSNVQTDSTP